METKKIEFKNFNCTLYWKIVLDFIMPFCSTNRNVEFIFVCVFLKELEHCSIDCSWPRQQSRQAHDHGPKCHLWSVQGRVENRLASQGQSVVRTQEVWFRARVWSIHSVALAILHQSSGQDGPHTGLCARRDLAKLRNGPSRLQSLKSG